MEPSPVVKAHDHARAAAIATQTADTTVAINEHALAAGEFSNAAQNTTSAEALRTLSLLAEHHQKLSELLKYPQEHPVRRSASDSETGEKPVGTSEGDTPESRPAQHELAPGTVASKALPQAVNSSQQRRHPPSRELSSSIASNLASKRGIRSKYRGQPLAPSVSNDQAPGNLDTHARRDGSRTQIQNMLQQQGKPSWVPPAQATVPAEGRHVEAEAPKAAATPSPSDEGFSRFYSTFGSIINRLSAPLAFAGLPLIAEEAAPEPAPVPEPPSRKRNRMMSSQVSNPEPDLSKIYSKATLRVLARDGHAPNDSFYVVPKTGHTASYANILTFDQKEKRRMAASLHGDDDFLEDPEDDDFVDAKESQAPHSPAFSRRAGHRSRADKDAQNVIEELYTENQGLKDMLDKLSKRLHAFESNAQQSHMALQESIRFMRPGSPLSGSGTSKAAPTSDELLRKRNKELQEELARAAQQMEVLEKDRAGMERTLHKYRDKWEKLKAGAKARRDAQGAADHNADSSKSP